MGSSFSTTGRGISVPALSRALGYSHPRVYQLLRAGQGPKLTPIIRSPASDTHGRRECFVAWEDAFAWVQARATSAPSAKERARAEEGLQNLKIKFIAQARKSGHVPRLPWLPEQPALTPRRSDADDSWLPHVGSETGSHIAVTS
jgi:hypothetical protein